MERENASLVGALVVYFRERKLGRVLERERAWLDLAPSLVGRILERESDAFDLRERREEMGFV
ncbi:hypothetical protein LguiA_004461 [Lonicera macranthoides]